MEGAEARQPTDENYRLFAQDEVTTALELELGTDDVFGFYRERAGKALINYGVGAGHIKALADADLTIFDPKTVIDRATYQQPNLPSKGFRYVLVNGTVVVADGRVRDGVLPGRPSRAPIR